MGYQTILYAEDGPVGTLTLNRPEDGNMFTRRWATRCAIVSPRCVARGARRRQPRVATTRYRPQISLTISLVFWRMSVRGQ